MSKYSNPEEITAHNYDRIAELWDKDHKTSKFWGEDFDRFFALLPPHSRLLEVGCGAGRDAKELIEFGYDYVGTDIAAGQIERARLNNPGAEFEQVGVYDLNFTEPFDGFWAAASLIHIPKSKINDALQAIHRSVRKGGFGFISMKEGEGEKLELREELDNSEFLFVYWQREEFADVLKENGFEVLSEDYLPFSQRSRWLTYIVRTI